MPQIIPAALTKLAGESAGKAKSNCESLPPNANEAPNPIKVPTTTCEKLWTNENLMN